MMWGRRGETLRVEASQDSSRACGRDAPSRIGAFDSHVATPLLKSPWRSIAMSAR